MTPLVSMLQDSGPGRERASRLLPRSGSPQHKFHRVRRAKWDARLRFELLHDLKKVVVHGLVILELLFDVTEVRQGIVGCELLGRRRPTWPTGVAADERGGMSAGCRRTLARKLCSSGSPFPPVGARVERLAVPPLGHLGDVKGAPSWAGAGFGVRSELHGSLS